MDENLRNAIAENMLMLKGQRLYFGERANQFSDRTSQAATQPTRDVLRKPVEDDDVLSALQAEAEAVYGPLTPEEIAKFAESL